MIRNEQEAFAYMQQALTFGIRLGLERMWRLMELLGHPQEALRCIHVAGTNGKGSVTAYCASILASAGLKIGVYTSPYLTRFHERIRILNGLSDLKNLVLREDTGEIGSEVFVRLLDRVKLAADRMISEGGEQPTEFELITAVAFLHFQEEKVDAVVLETGLGGRLDSTNVITKPLVAVITAIGYDHMDRLGSTIGEIASEKAGIIKPGVPVVLYDPALACEDPVEADTVRLVMEKACLAQGAALTVLAGDQVETVDMTPDGQHFRIHAQVPPIDRVMKTRLLGHYQPMNAALAVIACRMAAAALDVSLPDGRIARGIWLTRWPARLERVRRHPTALVDGAHNRQGAHALVTSLARLFPGRRLIFIVGVLKDKEYDRMLETVLAYAGDNLKLLICVTPDNPRALPARDLAATAEFIISQLIQSGRKRYNGPDMVRTIEQPDQAVSQALEMASPRSDLIVAFGSLYLAGTFRRLLGGYA